MKAINERVTTFPPLIHVLRYSFTTIILYLTTICKNAQLFNEGGCVWVPHYNFPW